MRGLNKKLSRDFLGMGLQVITIALLILGGVSVLVSSWSSYQSLQRSKESFYQEYRLPDIFAELSRAPNSVLDKIATIRGIDAVEGRVIKEGLVDVPHQSEPALGRFVSWHGNSQKHSQLYLREGRLPEVGDRLEVLLHESFAKAHRLKMGDSLNVNIGGVKRQLFVTGIGVSPEYVYALSPVSPLPDDKHFGVFWMKHEVLQALTAMQGAFNSLTVTTNKKASLPEIKRQIDEVLSVYGGVQSYDRSKQISNVFVEDEIRQQRVMSWVMPLIFLGVSTFILNVILSRLIALHRPQIATLKSLGYPTVRLVFHYFQLVTLILISGVVPSLFVGGWIGQWYAHLYQDFFRFPSIDFTLSLDSILYGTIAGLVPGWLGALHSLRQIVLLDPAEALRPPAPPNYREGLLERIGITQRLGVFSRMIIRGMLFKPIRTLASVIGMSAALAILINGSFWTDVIDYMMDRQFSEMRREDLTVVLSTPKSQNVFRELQEIPGVLMAEGERSLAVRLSFNNLSKEIGLLGWQANSQLSQVLDKDGNKILPVHGGILLSRYFESEFLLRAGETVRLKVLSGAQKEFNVPVVGFVDDLVGQQAYAVKSDIHAWLQEPDVIDTLQLKIDPAKAESIYVDLKERPIVAGITIRKLLLKSFTETVANMILTFTFILYGFAVAIAGAVIYNSSRISFSEKSWELASLRILGYDTKAAFDVLFLDVGFQVLIALIPGLFLGYWLSYLSTDLIHNETFKFPLIIEPSTYAAAVVVLLLTFLLSGVFLYRRVSRLDFSEALKARE